VSAAKLTKYDKQVIVRAVTADVPFDNDAVKKAAQDAIVKAMSPEVRKVYKTHPTALRSKSTYDISERECAVLIVGDVDYDEVLKPFVEAKEKRKATLNQLEAIIESCSTLKQLRERLPEFESYFPVEGVATPNLPAVANLVADLVKLGWKGAKK
jgi:hypothetical protein